MKIVLLGGTGFVGRRLLQALVHAGHDVRVLTRRRERHRDLLVLPRAWLVEGDVHNPAFLARECKDMDAAIDLVGTLHARRAEGFARVHAELPQKLAAACAQVGVPRLLHMSALGASADAPSEYLRSKAAGEAAVMRAPLATTCFRPSVIFGAGDGFTRRFARLLRRIPGVFPLACPNARLQPVYVDDVVRAFVLALTQYATHGRCYELCGPRAYTLLELVLYIRSVLGSSRRILPLGPRASWAQATLLEYLPGHLFTRDNFHSLMRDNVCGDFPALFAPPPTPLEAVAPAYLRAEFASP